MSDNTTTDELAEGTGDEIVVDVELPEKPDEARGKSKRSLSRETFLMCMALVTVAFIAVTAFKYGQQYEVDRPKRERAQKLLEWIDKLEERAKKRLKKRRERNKASSPDNKPTP